MSEYPSAGSPEQQFNREDVPSFTKDEIVPSPVKLEGGVLRIEKRLPGESREMHHTFDSFFYALREKGIRVSTAEWLELQACLDGGIINSISELYAISKGLLVKQSTDFATFNHVFGVMFLDMRFDEESQKLVPPEPDREDAEFEDENKDMLHHILTKAYFRQEPVGAEVQLFREQFEKLKEERQAFAEEQDRLIISEMDYLTQKLGLDRQEKFQSDHIWKKGQRFAERESMHKPNEKVGKYKHGKWWGNYMADATVEEIIALLQKEISQGARRHWEDIVDRKHKDTEGRNVQDREDPNSEGKNTVADDSMVIDTQTPLHDGQDSQIKQSAFSDNGDTQIKGNDGADSGQQGRATGRSHNWWEEYVQEGADIGELAKKINELQSSMDNFDPVESLSESEREHFMDIEVALRYLEQYFGKEGSLKDSDGSEVDLAELQKKAREQRKAVTNKRGDENTHSYEIQLVSQTVGSESWNKYNPDGIITPELYSEVIKRLRSIISTKTRRRARQTDIKATVRKIANAPATPEIVYKKKAEAGERPQMVMFLDVSGSVEGYAKVLKSLVAGTRDVLHDITVYYFLNGMYGEAYVDSECMKPVSLDEIIKRINGRDVKVMLYGDCFASQTEMSKTSGEQDCRETYDRIRATYPDSVWIYAGLQPADSSERGEGGFDVLFDTKRIFPMFDLSLNGIVGAVDSLMSKKTV